MAVVVCSGTTASVAAANTKSVDLVSGQYQTVGKGKLTLVALPSATGYNATLSIGGITLINDLPCPWFGTTGGLDLSAHVICSQAVLGGKIELFFRETAGGTGTVDYVLLFEPA